MSRPIAVLSGVLVLVASAFAEEPASTRPVASTQTGENPPCAASRPAYSLWTTPRLTGDWGGARTALEDAGVTFAFGLDTVFQGNLEGGRREHHPWRNTGTYLAALSLDTEKLHLWKGGTFYMLSQGSWDSGLSDAGYTGDLQGVNDNAGGLRELDVFEAWYEHALFDGKIRVKAGKISLSSDFDANAYANDGFSAFLNSGLVNNGQIPFPGGGNGAIGAQLVVKPTNWFYAEAAVADAQGDYRETGLHTAFHGEDYTISLYEFGLTPTIKTSRGELPGNYRVGLWYDPQPKARFYNDLGGRITKVPMKGDDLGFYTSMDQMLWKEKPGDESDTQGLGWFFRYGYADGHVNLIDNYWSTGGQYRGLLPTRDEDVLGWGVSQAIVTNHVHAARQPTGRETVLELYYRIQVFGWLHVTPDFQWILDPGANTGVKDGFVLGLRMQATF